MNKSETARPNRLTFFTPLRYPGGKAKLSGFIKSLLEKNRLVDGHYVEPYAGGAGVALELLFHEYVSFVHINDVSRPVWAFWKSVLDKPEELIRLVKDVRLSVASWKKQKKVMANPQDHSDLELGFATFFLNRTNRSGILNGGIIGGKDQSGPWKIDARFNRSELAYRIEQIAKLKSRIKLSRQDALSFLRGGLKEWPAKTLIYLDPPYYVRGRDLYLDSYSHDDHVSVAAFVRQHVIEQKWLVSYDNVPPIRKMYAGCKRRVYTLSYTAREMRIGSEVMFFSDTLEIPGPVRLGLKAA